MTMRGHFNAYLLTLQDLIQSMQRRVPGSSSPRWRKGRNYESLSQRITALQGVKKSTQRIFDR
ncbi:hypothetical protein BDW74DRAFT_154619 [Aspergillus multicolor]|uniref:uncharacterized protein n=1 Tax=Aspergillus multicolor TaxID=41759 RepID=UPI003CCE13A3